MKTTIKDSIEFVDKNLVATHAIEPKFFREFSELAATYFIMFINFQTNKHGDAIEAGAFVAFTRDMLAIGFKIGEHNSYTIRYDA